MTKKVIIQSLAPKYHIDADTPLTVSDANSIIIQALTGNASIEMRSELIIGCLKHLTGFEVEYDALRQKFKLYKKADSK